MKKFFAFFVAALAVLWFFGGDSVEAEDSGVTPSCPTGLYPQSYDENAPCGPIDPCIVHDPETGEGTTLWMIQVCFVDVAVDAPPTTVAQMPYLPATGSGTRVAITVIAILFILVGLAVVYISSKKPKDMNVDTRHTK